MQNVLDLQKLTVPMTESSVVVQSCTSSGGSCCNGTNTN
jgi:hypothetical protein